MLVSRTQLLYLYRFSFNEFSQGVLGTLMLRAPILFYGDFALLVLVDYFQNIIVSAVYNFFVSDLDTNVFKLLQLGAHVDAWL